MSEPTSNVQKQNYSQSAKALEFIENDIKLFPRLLMAPEPLGKERRRARALNTGRPSSRSSSLSKTDRSSDMRPIVDYFSPVVKRKAIDLVTSPASEAVAKMSKTDHAYDSTSPAVSVSDTEIESETGDDMC